MVKGVEVLARGLRFPEGPAFDRDGGLWCTELAGAGLVRWSRDGTKTCAVGGRPNALAFDGAGRAWFCDSGRDEVRRFDPDSEKTVTTVRALGDGPLDGPNDLAFDGAGNLVFTCPGESRRKPTGYVCCLKVDGTLAVIADGLRFPNGLAFADGGGTLVVAETYRQRLWKGAWDGTEARWINPEPWAEVGGPTGPDGMALAEDGLLYAAIFGQGCVKAVNPAGEVERVHGLPGSKPTNVAFDPSGELGLVVTEAERGLLLSLPELGPGAPLYTGGAVRGSA